MRYEKDVSEEMNRSPWLSLSFLTCLFSWLYQHCFGE